ncbi:TetR/AcrR family transcriptional regulator [Paenibacillus sp. sptzw28]|uniref:TetR/AcrR family transcriptional regulator n=1 Tax=Paenibacillus sp. sptzw28 TaxID=715179 RepID=UPI001C6EB8EA|nr:TetR/AcrR family transcriptional regulator [Paenibacillus sp. sptzw28]QYR22429.1 TetR/AcrR family transcriptional regulator [Paenibacillus sp. sptzw28]
MIQPLDRRIIRTKQLLREALMNLIEEKGIEGITVRDLTEQAGLNRGTFYLHYRDIADLLEQSKTEMLHGLLKIHDKLNPKTGIDDNFEKKKEAMALAMFEYFADNHRFFELMLGPKGDPSYIDQMKKFLKKIHYENHLRIQPNDANLLVPRDYLIAHAISSTLGIIQHWFESGMNLTPKEMVTLVKRLAELNPLQLSGLEKSSVEK